MSFLPTWDLNIKNRLSSSKTLQRQTDFFGMSTRTKIFTSFRPKIAQLPRLSQTSRRTSTSSKSRRISQIFAIDRRSVVEWLPRKLSILKRKSSTEKKHHIASIILQRISRYISTRGPDMYSKQSESKISSTRRLSILSWTSRRRLSEMDPSRLKSPGRK